MTYFLSDLLGLVSYVGCVIYLTLSGVPSVKNNMLFEYKKKHIKKGLMYYKDGWGWVDYVHFRPDHYQEVLEAILHGKKEITLSDGWMTPLRIPVSYSATYEINATQEPMAQWAQATAVSLHFMALNELVQQESPWFHGNQLSAWQFDDLSSGLFACLMQCPDESIRPIGHEIHDQQELLDLWSKQGMGQVKLKMDMESSWSLLEDKKIRIMIDAANWKVLDIIRQ